MLVFWMVDGKSEGDGYLRSWKVGGGKRRSKRFGWCEIGLFSWC